MRRRRPLSARSFDCKATALESLERWVEAVRLWMPRTWQIVACSIMSPTISRSNQMYATEE